MSAVRNIKAGGEWKGDNDKPVNQRRQRLIGMSISVVGFALLYQAS
jgi:hypothetical protein